MALDPMIHEAATAFAKLMAEKHPKAFPYGSGAWTRVAPLKIGIRHDIATSYPDVPVKVLKTFLARHTRSGLYLKATSVPGATRIDLNGDEAGIVSPEEAEYALALCRERHLRGFVRRQKNRILNGDISIEACAREIWKRWRGTSLDRITAMLKQELDETAELSSAKAEK
jgi:sRNA-binding protein